MIFFSLSMFIDSHCHLDRYNNLKDILERANKNNIQGFLSIGINRENSALVVSIAKENVAVYASCGLHPCDVEKDFQESSTKTLEEYEKNIQTWLDIACKNPKVVALGETGLDFFKYHKPSGDSPHFHNIDIRELQKISLKAHFHTALNFDLPLIIHMRQSEDIFLTLMDQWRKTHGNTRGVMHCFTGSFACAQQILQWPEWYISLSGILTFPNAQELRACVKSLPLNRLLLETDAPWLAPQKHRGETNEPSFLIETAKKLAEIKECSLEEVAQQTSENFINYLQKYKISHKKT